MIVQRQAETKKKSADEAMGLRITEAYHWLLVPGQPDPKGDVAWTDPKLQVCLGRDAARIAEEIVQHLTGLVGSNVEITIEIQADLAAGAGDKLVRDVTENCRTLRFTDFGFEED